MQTGMGFFASKTLLSAVELGVFEVIGPGPLNREGDGADALYANTADTAAFLDPASPFYLGGILRMANSRLYHHGGHLTEALRTGLPQSEDKQNGGGDLFGAIYADPQRLAEFLDAMAGRQLGNFLALAETFDFGRFATICDVGGAGGALSVAIARRKIEAAGLGERIVAQSGNFLTEELPAADIIAMGNILHDWGRATKEDLIRKAYSAVAAWRGGRSPHRAVPPSATGRKAAHPKAAAIPRSSTPPSPPCRGAS